MSSLPSLPPTQTPNPPPSQTTNPLTRRLTGLRPDGWQDPFSAPQQAYALLRALDPYHPVAVTLNCQNYHFGDYTVGAADLIMADVYPIGVNATFSKWGTACNATHGDCGCDNCKGNVQDVPDRLDDLARYERWLGLWPKTKLHNPQSFHGQGYWARDPTRPEQFVMNLLSLNHGAQGVISWVWPTSAILARAHGELASVVTSEPVLDFLVAAARPARARVSVSRGADVVDAAYWVVGDRMLVSVVNGGYVEIEGPVHVHVPGAVGIEGVPWDDGDISWTVQGNETLRTGLLPALGTSMVILRLRQK